MKIISLRTIKLLRITGFGFCLLAVILVFKTSLWINGSYEVEGVVLGYEESSSSTHNRKMYSLKYRYDDLGGQHHTVVSSLSSNQMAYGEGEKIRVLVSKNDGSDNNVNSFIELWVGHMIVGLIGIGWVIMSFMFEYMKKSSAQQG